VLRYRDFPFPLNVLLNVLTREEGRAENMHYGLFEAAGDSIGAAQERSTALLLSRLPPPPGRLLEVGIGLGTTLARLASLGYEAEGITPDSIQAEAARERFGDRILVHTTPLEAFEARGTFDIVVFQESSQYIDCETLFQRVRGLSSPGATVVVLDEFALAEIDRPQSLPRLDRFLAAAVRAGFLLQEELDLTGPAAPTVDYFLERIPRHRAAIESELAVTAAELDSLLESGAAYRNLYRTGAYGYRLLRFRGPRETAAGAK
jgi:cyclopropane fatty-acyl-phospholipid synthase-like methyltransferase